MSSYFNFHLTLTATNIVHVCLIFLFANHLTPTPSLLSGNKFHEDGELIFFNLTTASSATLLGFQQETDGTSTGVRRELNEEMFYWGENDGVKSGQALQCLGLAGKEKERDGLELWGKGHQREAVIQGRWMLPLPKARREQEEPLGNKPSRPLSSRSLSSRWCPHGPQAARIKGAWCCSC